MEPVSRTDQYKRVMKPLLERKRRARINRCLDELRDLLVAALQAEGETVTRLEKADILELTVRHVRRLNQRRRLTLPPGGHDPRHDALKFQQGFVAAAQQVQSFLIASPSLEPAVSSRLLTHLTSCASAMTGVPPSSGPVVPAMSRPPLMDLSMKPAHSPAPTPKILAPTPIREVYVGPQDLSMRRPSPRDDPKALEGKNSWRPWAQLRGRPSRRPSPSPPSSRRPAEARRSGSSACDEGGGAAGGPRQHLCGFVVPNYLCSCDVRACGYARLSVRLKGASNVRAPPPSPKGRGRSPIAPPSPLPPLPHAISPVSIL
ncbi:putative enhancer of split mbeta protein-like [Penaeus vannamei]|uniref:Putative enhancer of split mbeta protein-like n=1 Tax=Penaeus vannamei TaxID=6689 RepID=A0A3R7LX01_PENVA|nr:putative enhancer of split mbeta protein-like [Penaeus vannamei]